MYGCHINDQNKDKLIKECNTVYKLGGRIIQLFVIIDNENKEFIKKYKELNIYLKKNNMICVVHASYNINLSRNWNKYSFMIKQFIMEINMANTLGAIGIVVHLGKQLELSEAEAINNMYTSLLYVHDKTKHLNVNIFIETSTGQGSEICFKLEKLSHFYKKFSSHKNKEIRKRFKLCIDTAHIFAAGYDITSKKNIKLFLDNFDKMIGLDNIELIHLNDSKNELGSKIDRHENLSGNGYIGKESLLYLFKKFNKLNIPIILETPNDNIKNDLKMLKDHKKN